MKAGARRAKKWKIESWLKEVYPAFTGVTSEYNTLPPRELVIVATACLDLALAELISKRLMPYDSEIMNFIGADEDGRAPLGSFGARIQAAHLLGLINDRMASDLRDFKNVRNRFAHRVKIGFDDAKVAEWMVALWKRFHKASGITLSPEEQTLHYGGIRKGGASGVAVFRIMFAFYHAYFYCLIPSVTPVDPVKIDWDKIPDSAEKRLGPLVGLADEDKPPEPT